jgi:hypothetical protein
MRCDAICKNGKQCKHKRKFDNYCGNHKECPVCYCNKKLVSLACKHEICAGCSDTWLMTHNTCPICRAILKEPVQVVEPGRLFDDTVFMDALIMMSALYPGTVRYEGGSPMIAAGHLDEFRALLDYS